MPGRLVISEFALSPVVGKSDPRSHTNFHEEES